MGINYNKYIWEPKYYSNVRGFTSNRFNCFAIQWTDECICCIRYSDLL